MAGATEADIFAGVNETTRGTDWAASHEQINIVNKVRTMVQDHTPQRRSLREGSPSTLVHAAGLPSGSPAASITKIASNGSN